MTREDRLNFYELLVGEIVDIFNDRIFKDCRR